MPPFFVQYLCPKQSPMWQQGAKQFQNFYLACLEAQMVKPRGALAQASVVDQRGIVVFQC
jgi:hypothetical protein